MVRTVYKTPLQTRIKKRAYGKINYADEKVKAVLDKMDRAMMEWEKRKATPEDIFGFTFGFKPEKPVAVEKRKGGVVFILDNADYKKAAGGTEKGRYILTGIKTGEKYPRFGDPRIVKIDELQGRIGIVNRNYYGYHPKGASPRDLKEVADHEHSHIEYRNVHKVREIEARDYLLGKVSPKAFFTELRKSILSQAYAMSKTGKKISFPKENIQECLDLINNGIRGDHFKEAGQESMEKKEMDENSRKIEELEKLSQQAGRLGVKKQEYDNVLLHSTWSSVTQNLEKLVKKYEK